MHQGQQNKTIKKNNFFQFSYPLRIVTAIALLQILWILRLCKQEDRKSHNQDFISKPAWSTNSGQMECGQASGVGGQT